MFPPLINDITTTFPNPPQFVVIARAQAGRNFNLESATYDQQATYYKDLAPVACPLPADRCFKVCEEIAKVKMDWKIVSADSAAGRIEATATTTLMRYKDDIVIEVREGGSPSPMIHMRSKSRVGKGDLGANAKRIRKFFDALGQALATFRTEKSSPVPLDR
jgi:uncharacterized protein (DUF1499 family)